MSRWSFSWKLFCPKPTTFPTVSPSHTMVLNISRPNHRLLQVNQLHSSKDQHDMYEVELNQREEGVSASVKDIMHAAYLGSWISVYKACDAFWPELFPLFQSLWERDSLEKQVVSNVYVKFKTKVDTEWKIAETENLSFHQLLTRLAHPPPESYSAALKYQKKLSSYQFQENRKKIIQNNDFLPLQAALQENEAGPISHAWMTVYPNSEGEDTHYSRPDFLNAEEYCFTYQHRFDITDPTLSSFSSQGTVCSKPVMSSLHCTDCVKFNQGMNDRHHRFVKQLLQISKFAQFDVLQMAISLPLIITTRSQTWLSNIGKVGDTCVWMLQSFQPKARMQYPHFKVWQQVHQIDKTPGIHLQFHTWRKSESWTNIYQNTHTSKCWMQEEIMKKWGPLKKLNCPTLQVWKFSFFLCQLHQAVRSHQM